MPRSPIKGDHSKRVTVPLPQNLNDLESTARNAFPSYRKQLYYRGEYVLENQSMFKQNVNDGDVLIVRRDSGDKGPAFDGRTTHQSAYIQHPLERRQPRQATPPRQDMFNGPKFMGRSCYAGDYIEHAVESPHRTKPPTQAWEPNSIPMTSRSTYTENYPWHPPQHRQPAQKQTPRQSRVGNSPAFQGSSSYKMDYVKHEHQRPRSAGPRRRDNESYNDRHIPFNGSTTYGADYQKHGHAQSKLMKPQPQRQQTAPSPPFQGSSEYQKEYIKKDRPRPAIVHIEPERRSETPPY